MKTYYIADFINLLEYWNAVCVNVYFQYTTRHYEVKESFREHYYFV
jgi:hypothetical protein